MSTAAILLSAFIFLHVSSCKVSQPPQFLLSVLPMVAVLKVFLSFASKYQEWYFGVWFATETICVGGNEVFCCLDSVQTSNPNTCFPLQEANHVLP